MVKPNAVDFSSNDLFNLKFVSGTDQEHNETIPDNKAYARHHKRFPTTNLKKLQ